MNEERKTTILATRAQLEDLLDAFYAKVKEDKLIGPVFNDIAKVDWGPHVEKIHNFWDTLLFGAENYRGHPFPPHIKLGIGPEHFQRWLQLFFQTVDSRHHGTKADEIKMRALNIGRNFQRNLLEIEQQKVDEKKD